MNQHSSRRMAASHRALAVMAALIVVAVSACGSDSATQTTPTATTAVTQPPATATSPPDRGPVTYVDPVFQPNGNRLAIGSGLGTGFIQQITTKDINLGDVPTWVTGTSTPDGDVWVVALADGTVYGYRIPVGGQPIPVEIPGGRLAPGQPPVLAVQGNSVRLATTPANASPNSVPVYLTGNRAAYVDNLQRLTVLEPDGTLWRPDLKVLPDTRVVQVSPEKVLVLAEPTDRFPHSALGDNLEATAVVLVTVGVNEAETIYRSGDDVIESIAPLLADADGDGVDDVVLTVSNDSQIWLVVASSTGGGVVAISDPVDRLLGWRHLVAVGPLGPTGQTEIVEVLYPDAQGSVRFLSLSGGKLGVVATRTGYRSHEFGARNLEQAVAADIDRDNYVELVVPTLDRQHIAGVRHGPDGAVDMWSRPLGGTLASNIALLTRPDGTMSVAVATLEGSLRIWQ
ncbi:MAG: hypothetical protein F4129_11720 [Acidimicrobiia bacterium]|nr:hypothetical protein [Acidimicrobiia bacterium]MYL08190.1 hypothetical protein [Acidimicrobiia bacterium]